MNPVLYLVRKKKIKKIKLEKRNEMWRKMVFISPVNFYNFYFLSKFIKLLYFWKSLVFFFFFFEITCICS